MLIFELEFYRVSSDFKLHGPHIKLAILTLNIVDLSYGSIGSYSVATHY